MHFKKMEAMLKVKVASLKYNLGKAQVGKLTRNFSVCGFLITCPRNGQTSKITYNGHVVGEVSDGKIIVGKYNKDAWRTETLKYDILCNIRDELNPKKVEINDDAGDTRPENKQPVTGTTVKVVAKSGGRTKRKTTRKDAAKTYLDGRKKSSSRS